MPHVHITPDSLRAEAIQYTLSCASRAYKHHVKSKQLLLLTDIGAMTSTFQVTNNGAHVITTRHLEAACAAYNAIIL